MIKISSILAGVAVLLISTTAVADENNLFIHKQVVLPIEHSVKFNFSLKQNTEYGFSFSLPESEVDIDDNIVCQLFNQDHELLFQQHLTEPKCDFRVFSNVPERYYVKVSNLSLRPINLKLVYFNGGAL